MKKTLTATLIGLMSTFALFAAESKKWFDGGIADGFPNAATIKNGTWSWDPEYSDAAYAAGKVEIDGDAESPVDFNASSSVDLDRGSAVITTKIVPVVVRNGQIPTEIPECKTSFLVYEENAASNYYGIAKVEGVRKWVKLEGASWNGGEISLDIKMRRDASDGKDYANFVISENGGAAVTLTYNGSSDVEILVDDNKVKGLSFIGCGSLTDLHSTKQMQGGTTIPPAMLFNR